MQCSQQTGSDTWPRAIKYVSDEMIEDTRWDGEMMGEMMGRGLRQQSGRCRGWAWWVPLPLSDIVQLQLAPPTAGFVTPATYYRMVISLALIIIVHCPILTLSTTATTHRPLVDNHSLQTVISHVQFIPSHTTPSRRQLTPSSPPRSSPKIPRHRHHPQGHLYYLGMHFCFSCEAFRSV
jgi:hypothetical protein